MIFRMQDASTALGTSAWTFLERSTDKVAKALDRWKYMLLLVCTACYAFISCYQANRKLFWFDELFTVHVSRLPSLRLIWDALINGADFNPPLLYVFTHFSEAIAGPGPVGARLPAIVGFWIFCLCLFRFVSIRSSALAGFISMGFPLITTVYLYAFEARSYGLVLGFCGLGLISWQALTTTQKGRFWLALALFASLSGALLTHGYAFLLFVPFVAGELVRTIFRRRVDWIVWTALITASSAMLAFIPILRSLRALLGIGEVLVPTATKLAQSYDSLLGPAATFTMFVLGMICMDFLARRSAADHDVAPKKQGTQQRGFQPHEKVAVVAFLTIPVFSYLAARLSGAPMMDRYSLATVAGVAVLLGVAAAKRAITGLLVLSVLSALLARQFLNFAGGVAMKEPAGGLMISTVQEYSTNATISCLRAKTINCRSFYGYLGVGNDFFYAPPEVASRLIYLGEQDPINAKAYAHLHDCCGAPSKVANLDEIRATTGTFLIYVSSASYWKISRFAETGGTVSVRKIAPDFALLQVTYPSR
jgi:hypothetical protein